MAASQGLMASKACLELKPLPHIWLILQYRARGLDQCPDEREGLNDALLGYSLRIGTH
jgi:hypothetical protein